jgi:hypothetical protein
MIMRNGSGKDYRTLDVYTSAWLILQGFTPTLINEGQKIVFSFPSSKKLFDAISKFNDGATVEVARFVLTVKNLKAQIFSRKT